MCAVHAPFLRAAVVACACSVCSFVQADDPSSVTQPSPEVQSEASTPVVMSDEALRSYLHTTIVDVEYRAIDFDEFLEEISETHGINIFASWRRLDELGIGRRDVVEVKLRGISLCRLLEIVLSDLSDDLDAASFVVDDGMLIISSKHELDRNVELQCYDISDLIDSGYAVRRFANTPVLGMKLTGREFVGGESRKTRSQGGGAGGGGGGLFDNPDSAPAHVASMRLVHQFVDLLQDNIEPDSWRDSGGDIGHINLYQNTLYITHTAETHARIRHLLHTIRASMPQPLSSDAVIVELPVDEAARIRREYSDSYPTLPATMIESCLTDVVEGSVLFRATTCTRNGERIWFSALKQRNLAVDVEAFVGDSSQAYSPVGAFVTSGLELIALPLVKPDSDELSLDVQMAWIPTPVVTSQPFIAGLDNPVAQLDTVQQSMQTISASLDLKLGEAIALTIPQHLDDDGESIRTEQWLILRVREQE